MEKTDIYYQTNVSKTIFYPGNTKQEELGLVIYRQEEEEAILRFLKGTNQIMLCGGLSHMGKSHMIDTLHKNYNISHCHVWSYAKGSFFSNVNLKDIKAFTEKFIQNDINFHNNPTSSCLMIDEVIDIVVETREKSQNFIKYLLDHFEKLILFGGGASLTADEQNAKIEQACPTNSKIEFNPFGFKNINLMQAIEIFNLSYQKRGIYLPEEILRILAEGYLKYFYILGIIADSYDKYELLLKLMDQIDTAYESPYDILFDTFYSRQIAWVGKGSYFSEKTTNVLSKQQRELFEKTINALRKENFLEIIKEQEEKNNLKS